MITIEQAKERKQDAVGEQFLNPKGGVGTVVTDLSAGGYPQAEFTCPVAGCGARHLRKSDDWHTVTGLCRDHSEKRVTTGTRPRMAKVLPSDPPELVTEKQAYNELLTARRAANLAAKRARAEATKWRTRSEQLRQGATTTNTNTCAATEVTNG